MKILLLASLFPLLGLAQQPPASWKDLKYGPLKPIQIPKVEESTLPNGMKVYLLENHELPLIRGLALVRTGNLFDPADKVGLATMTGSLIRAGGTTAKSGDQLDEELENIAATVESQIGESFGSVSFSTLKERGDEVLSAFHDVLTTPAFREDKIELMRVQLRSGIARRNDDAHGIAQREFSSAVYGSKTPYGWDIEYSTLDNIRRSDIEAFYRRYFFPSNVILAIQGDFSAPDMKVKLEKLFAGWNEKQAPVPPFPALQYVAKPGIYMATKTDVTQTFFSLGHLGGVLSDKDYPALEVMSDILGGGFQSRLFQKVRTQLGYAYEISASWGANYDHPGMFEVGGSTKSASTAETLKAINGEVQRIRTQEVTADELQSAKDTVVNGFIFNFDTPAKTLNRILTYRYFGYPDDFIFQYQKAVQQVTRADILRVAKQYLAPDKFVIVTVGNPKDFGTPLDTLGIPVTNLDLTIPPPASAPLTPPLRKTAALAKVAAALGGEEKLAAIKDLTEKAELVLDAAAGGLRAQQLNSWAAPGHYREENTLPFGKVMTYSDGKTGWVASPQGVAAIPDAERKQASFEIFRMWPSLLLGARNVKELGQGRFEISDNDGNSVLLTTDPATGLPLSESYSEAGTQGEDVTETFSDWQETAGVKLPRKITISQNGKHFADVKVSDVLLNQGLTPEKLAQRPSPDQIKAPPK